MAEKEPTRPDSEDVPDVVLEELLAAFSKQDAEAIDFDDPSIDRMLGLGDSLKQVEANTDDAKTDDAKISDDAKTVDADPDTTTPSEVTDSLTSSNTVALGAHSR